MKGFARSGIASVVLCAGLAATAVADRPNVLILLADDLGYGEMGCQGNAQIPTPQIDSLARNGIRFTSGYVSGPVCGPSRAGLLTGRYQQRFGFEFNLGASGSGLSPEETTLAERLRAAGYATGLFGKWHLGHAPDNRPTAHGFDRFYGFLPACRTYRCRPGELGKSLLDEEQPRSDYMTDMLAAEAATFIEKHRDRPWFVYLPFGAVHASPQGGKKLVPQDAGKYRERFPGIQPEQRQIFAGMLSAMDDAVGTVLGKLRALDLEENTLIFFLSDNGGPTWQTTSGNGPLRGSKGDVLEGGIRVPFLVQWKGRLPAGKVDDRPVIALDILPTVLAAVGQPGDARLEGVNLLPYLEGEKPEPPHAALFWRYGRNRAVRMGDWKLASEGDGDALYNLVTDIAEKKDLSATEPDRLAEMRAAYEAWNSRNVPAKWGRPGRAGVSDPRSSDP